MKLEPIAVSNVAHAQRSAKKMKFLILILFFASGLLASDDLKLSLSFPSEKMAAGRSLRATASIENTGSKNYTLVLPGDGSNSAWRTPIVGFSSVLVGKEEKHPKEIPLYRGGRCGNINTLKEDEVFTLNPGEKKDLGSWVGYLRIEKPGKYRVVYYYQNDPSKSISGLPLGGHAEGVEEKIKNSSPVYLVSNELIVEVNAEPDGAGQRR